jgi:hypothetical protein
MEARFRRFAWFFAITSAVVLASFAAYFFYDASTSQKAAAAWNDLWTKATVECEKDRQSQYCAAIENAYKELLASTEARNDSHDRAELLLGLAAFMPLLSAFMFIGLRWVATGQGPRLPRRDN